MAKRKPQLEMLKKQKNGYGGELRKTREGRKGPRPIATKYSMHLILRSEQATKEWSFRKSKNESKIKAIVEKFSMKYGVQVVSMANVGNHLHFQIKLTNRFTYKAFIKAITGAIAMAVTGSSRWNPLKKKFWDYRPFTKIVNSLRYALNLKDYMNINQLEGFGVSREEPRWIIADEKRRPWHYSSA